MTIHYTAGMVEYQYFRAKRQEVSMYLFVLKQGCSVSSQPFMAGLKKTETTDEG